MKVGLIGAGRMGSVLAKALTGSHQVYVYDYNGARLAKVAANTGATAAASLSEVMAIGTVILAVPDEDIISCIDSFNKQPHAVQAINIATNITQADLANIAAPHIQYISAKFVGHAAAMASGNKPVIIVDEKPAELAALTAQLFASVGRVIMGKADLVGVINTITAEKVLTAAIGIEKALRGQHITEPSIIEAALSQVGAGIIKAYAEGNMGPFAREIMESIKNKNLHK